MYLKQSTCPSLRALLQYNALYLFATYAVCKVTGSVSCLFLIRVVFLLVEVRTSLMFPCHHTTKLMFSPALNKILAAVLPSLECISLISHVHMVYMTRQLRQKKRFHISLQHIVFWELTFWHNTAQAVAQQKYDFLCENLIYKLLIENLCSVVGCTG